MECNMTNLGKSMYDLAGRLFPICRSITGQGVRDTFAILKEYCPEIELFEVETGTKVFDWTVPNEWRIDEAYIENSKGDRIIDFKENNLHVLGYSTPIDSIVNLSELKEHIYTLKDQPEVIPYVTSYYKERWGFAMTDNMKNSLPEDDYHVVIKSELFKGSLTYGELIIPGQTDEEIFLSTYICHPSMANNECSGPSLMVHLADYIKKLKNRRYTYRIVFVPETIGAITYLSKNLNSMKGKVIAGFNLTCVGDDRTYSIVHSRYANTLADRVLSTVLKYHYPKYCDYSYLKRGSDERQYQAPGVDLPLVCFCRSKYHVYPEYHTSADNMELISPQGLQGSLDVMVQCIDALEMNNYYCVTCLCEPQLGKRGLVPTMSSKETYLETLAMKDVLAYADGSNDLIELAQIIEQPISVVVKVVGQLLEADLLKVMKR